MVEVAESEKFLQRISQKVFVVLAVVLLPALVASFMRALGGDVAYGVIVLQVVLYVWVVVLALPLQRIGLKVRCYSIAIIASIVALSSIARSPDSSIASIWLLLAVVFLSTVTQSRLLYLFVAAVFPSATLMSNSIWSWAANWESALGYGIGHAGLALCSVMMLKAVASDAKQTAASERKLRTERDQALQQLQIEEQRRTAVSENANISFFKFDYASGRCYGDRVELARHGLSPDAEFWDVAQDAHLYAPDSQVLMQTQITEMSQQPAGATAQFTLQMRVQPSNELRSFRISGLNVEVDGKILFAGASIDITDEIQAIEKAEELSSLIELVSNEGGVGLIEFFPDTRTFKCNSEVSARLGVEHSESERDIELFYAHQTEEVRATFRTPFEALAKSPNGELQGFVHPFYLANGDLRYMRVSRIKRDLSGRTSFLGLSLDITDEVNARERAEKQAEQLKLITEQGKIGLYEFDLEKGVMHANSVLCERFGIDPELGEISQEVMLDNLAEDSRASALEHIERGKTAPEGYFATSTVHHIFSDGLVHKIRIFEKIERRQGRPFYVGAAVDVTDEVEAREQAEAAMSKLAQEQDRQAQMYAVIGHELRTPAASLQMMLDDLGDGESLDATLARANIEQLLSVIDTLRAVAQPERMAQTAYDDVQLDEMLQQQAQNFQPMATRHGIQLKTDFTGLTIHPVHIQKTLLRQVLSNLIKNALIHSGGTELEVGASGRLLNGERKVLRLWIADNGQGVSADKVEKLFEAFVRGSTEAEGTGLGLHICREILRNMGGDLRYEPRPEGGSCFVIELEVDLAKTDLSEPLKPEANESPLKGMRVLVAEDNKTIQMLTQKMLEKQGAQVTVGNNGKEALEAFAPGKFDLVLSDIFMPEMNGYEFAREVRLVDTAVPVIGLTAATIGKETDEMLAAGATAVLSKPINLARVKDILGEIESSEVFG